MLSGGTLREHDIFKADKYFGSLLGSDKLWQNQPRLETESLMKTDVMVAFFVSIGLMGYQPLLTPRGG